MHNKTKKKHLDSHALAIYHPQAEIRSWLVRLISASSQFVLLWQSETAEELYEKIEQQPVDVLLLDAGDARQNVQSVLSYSKECIILLISNKANQTGEIFNGLGAGATDVASLSAPLDEPKNEVLIKNKLQLIISLLRTKPKTKPDKQISTDINLVVIGSSTGGPEALRQLLGTLSSGLHAAIIIVQHLDNLFINEFVSWLSQHCKLPVTIAEQDKQPQVGHIYVAHPKAHLVIDKNHQFDYVEKPGQHAYQPSINVFFSSVNKYWTTPGCAVLLTGMGKDGAKGLKKLLESGWRTYAQEKKSCAVYGMPKAALEMGAVEKNQSLKKITEAICETYEEHQHG